MQQPITGQKSQTLEEKKKKKDKYNLKQPAVGFLQRACHMIS